MLKKLVFSVIIAVFVYISMSMFSNTAIAGELDEFLVAYWPFDEDSGNKVVDATGNGNDGTINGAKWVEGKFESALKFDGVDDHVVIPDSDVLDITAELTFSAWVKFNDLPSGVFKNVMRKEGSYVLEITGGNIMQMNTWAGGNWQNGQAVGGPTLQENVWYFMAGVKLKEGGLEAYLDGDRIAEGNKKGDIDITSNPLYIGAGSPGWLPVNAIIDEIKIFNKALTPEEIKQVMRESGGREGVEQQGKVIFTWGRIKDEYAW